MKNSHMSLKRFQRRGLSRLVAVVVAGLSVYGCNAIKAVGKNPSGEALKRIEALPTIKTDNFKTSTRMFNQLLLLMPQENHDDFVF